MATFVRFGGVVLNTDHVSAVEWYASTKDCHVYTLAQREASMEDRGTHFTEKGRAPGVYRFTGDNARKVWEYFTVTVSPPDALGGPREPD